MHDDAPLDLAAHAQEDAPGELARAKARVGRRSVCLGVLALGALGCRRATVSSDGGEAAPTKQMPRKPQARRHQRELLRFAFTDATTLTSASPDAACAWNVAAGTLLWHVPLVEPYKTGETRSGMVPDVDDAAKRVVALERAGVVVHRSDGAVEPIGVSPALGNGTLVGFGPKGASVIANVDGAVVVRRIEDGATIFERSDLGRPHGQSRDRRLLALQDVQRKKLTIVDVTSGAVLGTADVRSTEPVFSDDGKELVVAVSDELRVFDVATGAQRLRIPLPRESSDGRDLAVTSDHFAPLAFARGVIVARHTPSELVTFDAATGQRKTLFPAHPKDKNSALAFAVTPDGGAAVGADPDALFWFNLRGSNLRTPKDITPPVPRAERALIGSSFPLTRTVRHVAIAPDDRWVAFSTAEAIYTVDSRSVRNEAIRLDPS